MHVSRHTCTIVDRLVGGHMYMYVCFMCLYSVCDCVCVCVCVCVCMCVCVYMYVCGWVGG